MISTTTRTMHHNLRRNSSIKDPKSLFVNIRHCSSLNKMFGTDALNHKSDNSNNSLRANTFDKKFSTNMNGSENCFKTQCPNNNMTFKQSSNPRNSDLQNCYQLNHKRDLSWASWMATWKSDDKAVRPGRVSGARHVPDHIPKPLYVLSGIVPPQEGEAEIKTSDQIQRMRESCGIAREVLKVTGQAVQVGINKTTR